MTKDKCLIEKTKRSRVKGTGPRRKELVTFYKLGEVSSDLVSMLNNYMDINPHSDLGTDLYGISQACNYEEVFNVGSSYRQLLLQENPHTHGETADEFLYTEWSDDMSQLKSELSKFFKTVYRARISEMVPFHELKWHIDSDTSVICRAQICLSEGNSVLKFKDKEGIKELTMKPNEVWFINTGWPHSVVNDNNTRRSVIVGFDFLDLDETLQRSLQK